MSTRVKLNELLTQVKDIEYIDDPGSEKYITVSGRGNGVKERIIKEGKTPVPFSAYRVKSGQLIYSRIGASEGAFGIIPAELNGAVVSKDFPVFSVDEDRVNIDYLVHYLTSAAFCSKVAVESFGATMTRFKEDNLLASSINLPSLSEQDSRVEKLNKAKALISLRQLQLHLLDNLIKSRFVEMFGTLGQPAQDFRKDVLKNLCYKITDGKHGGCTQEDGTDRYFIGAREIYDDAVHYDTAPQIKVEEFEKDYKRCNVEKGDFLIVNTGATIGKSAIAIDERTEHTLLQKSVALLKIKRSVLHPVFLKHCYIVNDEMYKVESASAQPNLLLSKINETRIYVPPMSLQEEFVAFAGHVNKTKSVIQKSLDETQLLFDSLMQKYFG